VVVEVTVVVAWGSLVEVEELVETVVVVLVDVVVVGTVLVEVLDVELVVAVVLVDEDDDELVVVDVLVLELLELLEEDDEDVDVVDEVLVELLDDVVVEEVEDVLVVLLDEVVTVVVVDVLVLELLELLDEDVEDVDVVVEVEDVLVVLLDDVVTVVVVDVVVVNVVVDVLVLELLELVDEDVEVVVVDVSVVEVVAQTSGIHASAQLRTIPHESTGGKPSAHLSVNLGLQLTTPCLLIDLQSTYPGRPQSELTSACLTSFRHAFDSSAAPRSRASRFSTGVQHCLYRWALAAPSQVHSASMAARTSATAVGLVHRDATPHLNAARALGTIASMIAIVSATPFTRWCIARRPPQSRNAACGEPRKVSPLAADSAIRCVCT
jgi:hypothetical protein